MSSFKGLAKAQEQEQKQGQEKPAKRVFLPPHTLSPIEEEYVASLSPDMRRLHEIATESLGSSYYVKWTHGFRKWLAKRDSSAGTTTT